jgi:hypothetical protein
LFLLLTIHSQAAVVEPFQWLNPVPTGNTLVTTAYGNGTYIAFDSFGTILESTNVTNWIVRTNLGAVPVSACYGNSAFVAVGKHGLILCRVNGNWTTITSATTSGTTNDLNQVVFGNGNFVAVGANGTVMNSSDGLHWGSCSSSSGGTTQGRDLSSIAFGNGFFLTISGNYTFTSHDTCEWTANTNTPGIYTSVTFGNGRFLKVGSCSGIRRNGFPEYAQFDQRRRLGQ